VVTKSFYPPFCRHIRTPVSLNGFSLNLKFGGSRDDAEQFELRLLLDRKMDALNEDTQVLCVDLRLQHTFAPSYACKEEVLGVFRMHWGGKKIHFLNCNF